MQNEMATKRVLEVSDEEGEMDTVHYRLVDDSEYESENEVTERRPYVKVKSIKTH
jgi:hypothetical protein